MSHHAAATAVPSARAVEIADRVEAFVRTVVAPYEKDPRAGSHGPSEELVAELRAKARSAGVMTPHILKDGSHLSQRETALVLRKSGLSPLGPVACNTMRFLLLSALRLEVKAWLIVMLLP